MTMLHLLNVIYEVLHLRQFYIYVQAKLTFIFSIISQRHYNTNQDIRTYICCDYLKIL